jgi:hypothetical protein
MLRRPPRTYALLLPSLVAAFALSAVGKDSTPSDGGLYYVGATGWVAFSVLLLVTLVFSLVVGVRAIGRTSTNAGSSL